MDIETLALAKGYTNKQIKKLSVNGIKGDKGDPGKDAVIDTTLSNSGEAADAKVVGNEISSLKEDLDDIAPKSYSVNRYKPMTDGWVHGLVISSDGSIGGSENNSYCVTPYIEIDANKTYTMHQLWIGKYISLNIQYMRGRFYDSDKNALPLQDWNIDNDTSVTFTTPSEARYVRFTVAKNCYVIGLDETSSLDSTIAKFNESFMLVYGNTLPDVYSQNTGDVRYINVKKLSEYPTRQEVSNEIDSKVDSISTRDFSEPILVNSEIVIGKGYNFSSLNIGDNFTRVPVVDENCSYQIIPIEEDTIYYIYGKGTKWARRLFIVLDSYNYILDIETTGTDYRQNPRQIIPPKNAYRIIVNYMNYNSETDFAMKQKSKTIEGLFDSIYSPLMDKTILLLGDSIIGNDRINGVRDFLAQYTGATVINGAIGGTRLCGTTRGNSSYTPFDGENLVSAIVSGDWSTQEANKDSVTGYVATQTLPDLQAMDIMDVDIVIMNWMSNDYTSNTTKQQYQSAYQNIIEMLLTKNPNLIIISATMEWFTTSDGDTDTTSLYAIGTGYDACDCTIEIAEKMHIPVVDMYRNMPLGQITKTIYMDSDYVHLNTNGNKIYASLLFGKLRELGF